MMEITNALDEGNWRDFVEQQPLGNVFHTPEIFQVFAQAKGHRPQLWAAVQERGAVQALFMPVELSLYGGPLKRLTTRLIAYGGVLCGPDAQGCQALQNLLATAVRQTDHQALFTELRNLADTSALQRVLGQCGFKYEEHLNYVIHLTDSPERLLQRIGPRTRKHIRQGLRRAQVQVHEIMSAEELASSYALLRNTYRAAGVPLADRSLFSSAFQVLQPLDMVKFWLATIGDVPVATSVELLYKDVMYGWYGGVDRSYGSYSPGELLMWHILKWGAEHGYRLYDFGGAGRPGETYKVRDFKAKFGGEPVCYGRNTCVHSPWLFRVSTLGYNLYRRLIRRRSRKMRRLNNEHPQLEPTPENDDLAQEIVQ